MRRKFVKAKLIAIGLGSLLLQSCPFGSFSDCFGGDTISRREYLDLNVFAQLLYRENGCGRYEPI